jgi:predicted dehydrogenase
MKQVAQRPRDGAVTVEEVPAPSLRPGWVLVQNHYSLLSAGTERTKIQLGGKNLVEKARSRPDLVRKVVEKARVEGVGASLATARDRLDALAPLGYSSAGVVLEVGADVDGVAPGDRVACAGEGWATHAEVIAVPKNLIARVPPGVDLADAAYATLGAIALHAVHQAEATIGERIGVVGLGLVGQLAMRILQASGCEVVGVDLDPAAVELARQAGAQALVRSEPTLERSVEEATHGLGLDAVLICADARSSDPLELAARLARDRGRLVLVGNVPVTLNRELLYRKELELRLSRSYGPGRYDRDYEEHGRDVPASQLRWTEQRNLQAFVDLIASGRVDPSALTTHRFPVDQASDAYSLLTKPEADSRPFGILLEYPHERRQGAPAPVARRSPVRETGAAIGLIGAGAFARGTLLPALTAAGATLSAVASQSGLTARDAAARFGFERAAASADEILADERIDAVMIATRHDSHASLAARALAAGKAVFLEKPLALSERQLVEVEQALRDDSVFMVGFNRRFAPLVERLRSAFGEGVPRQVAIRVNAGRLEAHHWLHDPAVGGGRLLGEGCHFVDFVAYLADSPIVSAYATAVPQPTRPLECSDCFSAVLRCANGTIGTVVYSGDGDARLAKERVEAFGSGVSAILDDFRRLEIYALSRRSVTKERQDKGHRAQMTRFVQALRGEAAPPLASSYIDSTRATLALVESLRSDQAVTVQVEEARR